MAKLTQMASKFNAIGRIPRHGVVHSKSLLGTASLPFSSLGHGQNDSRSQESKWQLPEPTVLYSDNHLLVVNKPAGWKSSPDHSPRAGKATKKNNNHKNSVARGKDAKCLLSHLCRQLQGGGSTGQYLSPLHRLDQPATGVLIFGKTSKAASRIQSNWKFVEKMYLAVLDTRTVSSPAVLDMFLSNLQRGEWTEIKGLLERRQRRYSSRKGNEYGFSATATGGWSVSAFPWSERLEKLKEDRQLRLCRLEYRVLDIRSPRNKDGDDSTAVVHHRPHSHILVGVRCRDGARHMIRAMLPTCVLASTAADGVPGGMGVAGDLRYGGQKSQSLPDRSVALHAFRLKLPSTKRMPLGTTTDRSFVAPIPPTWTSYFGWSNKDVQQLLTEKDATTTK